MPIAGRRWTEEDDARLVALVAAGVKTSVIAEEMGRAVHGIRLRIKVHVRAVIGPLDRRENSDATPERPLRLCGTRAEAMRRITEMDPLSATDRDRRAADILARMIRRADLVEVEGEDDAAGLIVPFLDAADRLVRMTRLG